MYVTGENSEESRSGKACQWYQALTWGQAFWKKKGNLRSKISRNSPPAENETHYKKWNEQIWRRYSIIRIYHGGTSFYQKSREDKKL